MDSRARIRFAPLLSFYLWACRTAAYVPVPFRTDKYYGVDGPWQAVTVQVGGWDDDIVDSAQWTSVDMMPGGGYTTYALSSDLCSSQSSDTCGSGGLWDVTGTAVIQYEPSIDLSSSSGLYMAGQIHAQDLNIGVDGNSESITNASIAAVDTGNQTLPNKNQIDLEIGALALGADEQQQVFTTGIDEVGMDTINAWIFPGYLYNKSLTDSYSFSLHIGSTAFDYPGSMYFGGYDKGRAIGPATSFSDDPPQLQDIVIGVETGGSPFNFDSKKGLLLSNTSSNSPIAAQPEPLVPYLFLPKQTCDQLATQLPVSFDSSGYYLWNTDDPTYTTITTSAAYLGFVFPPATGDTSDVTIKVPFQLLVLNLTSAASGKDGETPYFPCMPYEPDDGKYLLGRAFLQAAFYGRNWNRHVSWLAQAPGPGSSKSGLGSEPVDIKDSDTSLDFYEGDSYLADSWSDYWTPLPGTSDQTPLEPDNNNDSSSPSSTSSSGLSTGAKAGIGVGAAVAGIAVLALAVFFFLRRRKSQQREKAETASGQEPFVGGPGIPGSHSPNYRSDTSPRYAHYGNDAKSYQAVNQYDHSQQGYYAPNGGGEGYEAYKPPGPQGHGGSYQMNELSGTGRSAAHELPGHEPVEMDVDGPKPGQRS